MGRTLHYTLEKENPFTNRELNKIAEINEQVNQRFPWTCEEMDAAPFAFHPNWDKFNTGDWGNPRSMGFSEKVWNMIDKRFGQMRKEGYNYVQAVKLLRKENLIRFYDGDKTKIRKIGGFTKVRGNEFNAFLVLQTLLIISKSVPTVTISLHDEGMFLYCDIKIHKGKARPDFEAIQEKIDYHCRQIVGNQFSKKLNFGSLPSEIFNGVLPPMYSEALTYLQQDFDEMNQWIYSYRNAFMKKKPNGFFCFTNCENLWVDPSMFHRQIKIEDFKDYSEKDFNVMAGFYGEHWKLSDKDSETESLKMINQIFGNLPNDLKKHLGKIEFNKKI